MSVNVTDVSTPEIYLESQDFRFFLNWFDKALSTIKANTENFYDNYDPLRCPQELLWLLADTMGYKYDDRVSTAFNRLVLLYFMSMIKNRGSKDGVTLAAEVNLAQLSVMNAADENPALANRLENTSIPVNSAYVQAFTEQGYIDVVYFATQVPVDTCMEYVRPAGMYCFQHAGVQFQGRTRVTVDARLTDSRDVGMSYGPTQVGHYTRADYASLQKSIGNQNDPNHVRRGTYYRNSKYEGTPSLLTDPGYRSLYSLQLANNENIFRSLIYDDQGNPHEPDAVFTIGFGPQSVGVTYPDDYRKPPYQDPPLYNLRVDTEQEQEMGTDVYTIDVDRTADIVNPRPAVNPPMGIIGTAISMNPGNTQYTADDGSGRIIIEGLDWENVIFHDREEVTGQGHIFNVGNYTTLNVYIDGNATSFTVTFYEKSPSGVMVPIYGMRTDVGNPALALSTSDKSAVWQFNITAKAQIVMYLTAVSGGYISVKGRAGTAD